MGRPSSHPAGPSFCGWRRLAAGKRLLFSYRRGRGFLANYMCKGVSQLTRPLFLCVRETGGGGETLVFYRGVGNLFPKDINYDLPGPSYEQPIPTPASPIAVAELDVAHFPIYRFVLWIWERVSVYRVSMPTTLLVRLGVGSSLL